MLSVSRAHGKGPLSKVALECEEQRGCAREATGEGGIPNILLDLEVSTSLEFVF